MSQATDTLATFLRHIAELDADACGTLLADDAEMLSPVAPEGLPRRVSGRDAIVGLLQMLPQMFSDFEFHDLEFQAGEDPSIAFAFARSECTLTTGARYDQDYVFFARVHDGAITEYREYMDSSRAAAAIAAVAQ